MIEVHLYGKLRKYSDDLDPTTPSVASVGWQPADTVRAVIERLGIPSEELGSNKFLNGRYADLDTLVQDGDRLGLFPADMQLLYKWYFAPHNTAGAPSPGSAAPNLSNEESNSASGMREPSKEPKK